MSTNRRHCHATLTTLVRTVIRRSRCQRNCIIAALWYAVTRQVWTTGFLRAMTCLVGYSWIRIGIPIPAHCQQNRDVDKLMLTQPKLIGAPKLSCHQA